MDPNPKFRSFGREFSTGRKFSDRLKFGDRGSVAPFPGPPPPCRDANWVTSLFDLTFGEAIR